MRLTPTLIFWNYITPLPQPFLEVAWKFIPTVGYHFVWPDILWSKLQAIIRAFGQEKKIVLHISSEGRKEWYSICIDDNGIRTKIFQWLTKLSIASPNLKYSTEGMSHYVCVYTRHNIVYKNFDMSGGINLAHNYLKIHWHWGQMCHAPITFYISILEVAI